MKINNLGSATTATAEFSSLHELNQHADKLPQWKQRY